MPRGGNFLYGQEKTRSDAQRVLSQMALKGEAVQGMVIPEIDRQLKRVYVKRPSGLIIAGCSDERLITDESAEDIKHDPGLDAAGPILRIFGAATGGARIALVTMAAEHPHALDNFTSSDFGSFTIDFTNRAEKHAGVKFAVHSAAKNEENQRTFNPNSKLPPGCAHATLTGPISADNAHDPLVIEVMNEEGLALLGQARAAGYVRIPTANALFIRTALDNNEKYSVDRPAFKKIGAPVMVLAEDHLPVDKTLVVANFAIDEIADPRIAKDMNRLHYTYDFTQLAEVIIKSFPEIDFDPVTLFQAMHADVVATRGKLAGGNPRALEMKTYGNVDTAIEYLNSIKNN